VQATATRGAFLVGLDPTGAAQWSELVAGGFIDALDVAIAPNGQRVVLASDKARSISAR